MPHSLEVSKIKPPFSGSGYGARVFAYEPHGLNLSIRPLGFDLSRVGHISNLSLLCLWMRSNALWALKDVIGTFFDPRACGSLRVNWRCLDDTTEIDQSMCVQHTLSNHILVGDNMTCVSIEGHYWWGRKKYEPFFLSFGKDKVLVLLTCTCGCTTYWK